MEDPSFHLEGPCCLVPHEDLSVGVSRGNVFAIRRVTDGCEESSVVGEDCLLLDGIASKGVDVEAVVLGTNGNLSGINGDGNGGGLVLGGVGGNDLLARDHNNRVEGGNHGQVLVLSNGNTLGLGVKLDSLRVYTLRSKNCRGMIDNILFFHFFNKKDTAKLQRG